MKIKVALTAVVLLVAAFAFVSAQRAVAGDERPHYRAVNLDWSGAGGLAKFEEIFNKMHAEGYAFHSAVMGVPVFEKRP